MSHNQILKSISLDWIQNSLSRFRWILLPARCKMPKCKLFKEIISLLSLFIIFIFRSTHDEILYKLYTSHILLTKKNENGAIKWSQKPWSFSFPTRNKFLILNGVSHHGKVNCEIEVFTQLPSHAYRKWSKLFCATYPVYFSFWAVWGSSSIFMLTRNSQLFAFHEMVKENEQK